MNEDERESTDRFMKDLLAEIAKTAERLLAIVHEQRSKLNRQQYAVFVNSAKKGMKFLRKFTYIIISRSGNTLESL